MNKEIKEAMMGEIEKAYNQGAIDMRDSIIKSLRETIKSIDETMLPSSLVLEMLGEISVSGAGLYENTEDE